MKKKTIQLLILVTSIGILSAVIQSCGKSQLYYRYRYVITQITSNDRPTQDSIVAQSTAGLRLWIVPERYYDRFSYTPALSFFPEAYAGSLDLLTNDDDDGEYQEKNDSLMGFDIWYLPGADSSYVDSASLDDFVQYRLEGKERWMSETDIVKEYNSKAGAKKNGLYIDVRFDKFVHYTGYGYFSVKTFTQRSTKFLYSVSQKVNLSIDNPSN